MANFTSPAALPETSELAFTGKAECSSLFSRNPASGLAGSLRRDIGPADPDSRRRWMLPVPALLAWHGVDRTNLPLPAHTQRPRGSAGRRSGRAHWCRVVFRIFTLRKICGSDQGALWRLRAKQPSAGQPSAEAFTERRRVGSIAPIALPLDAARNIAPRLAWGPSHEIASPLDADRIASPRPPSISVHVTCRKHSIPSLVPALLSS